MTHESEGKSNEWYTPRYIFDALGVTFDLDVAAPQEGPRHVPASRWLWENGELQDWHGFVWMNPPFGDQKTKQVWLRKFFNHGNGIALLPDRTSAAWFQEAAKMAGAILFVAPKIKFERADGSIGESPAKGTALFASGTKGELALLNAEELGFVVSRPININDYRKDGDTP